jgi:hypothetical protein
MSTFEKIMVMALAICTVVYGGYFLTVLHISTTEALGVDVIRPLMFKLAAAMLGLTVAGSALFSFALKRAGNTGNPMDERDRTIWTRTGSKAIHILYTGIVAAIALSIFEFHPVIVIHVLLATVAIGDITRVSLMLVDYRKGI